MSDLKLVIGDKNRSPWSLRAWLLLRHLELEFDEILAWRSAAPTPSSRSGATRRAAACPCCLRATSGSGTRSRSPSSWPTTSPPCGRTVPMRGPWRARSARSCTPASASWTPSCRSTSPRGSARPAACSARWRPRSGGCSTSGADPDRLRAGWPVPVRTLHGGRRHVRAGLRPGRDARPAAGPDRPGVCPDHHEPTRHGGVGRGRTGGGRHRGPPCRTASATGRPDAGPRGTAAARAGLDGATLDGAAGSRAAAHRAGAGPIGCTRARALPLPDEEEDEGPPAPGRPESSRPSATRGRTRRPRAWASGWSGR